MPTGKKAGKGAGKTLEKSKTPKDDKTAAGSALAQLPRTGSAGGKGRGKK